MNPGPIDPQEPLPSQAASTEPGPFSPERRRLLAALAVSPLLAALGGAPSCSGGSGPGPDPVPKAPTRSWRMGFSPNPPRPDAATLLHGLDLWSPRADLAAIHEELPWTDLLGGQSADAILDRDKVPLVNLMRSKGLKLLMVADLTDGLSRGEEAPQLRKLGRSIREPAVQQVYRDYVLAVSRKLAPEYLALAAETNLTRALAPAVVYGAEVQAANAAAADLRAAGTGSKLLVSVQVETAWGPQGSPASYVGIGADLRDFPFLQVLGLSSYPYFLYGQPEDIPADYYSRLLQGTGLPAMVTEGGWCSASVGSTQSSPDKQARYVNVHARLLDGIAAQGLLQLLFADLDLSAWPQPVPANLPLFTTLGLTDANFNPKPALGAWDALYARKLQA